MQHAFTVTNSTLNKGSSYHLSIQSDLNGLCFCVLDLDSKQYVALQSLPFRTAVVDYDDLQAVLGRILSSEPLLNLNFNSVSCMYNSRNATLIPNILADKTQLKRFLEFNTPLNELDEVHSCPIPTLDAEAVFAIPSPLAAKLTGKYNRVRFYHQCVPMLTLLPKQAKAHKYNELLAVNVNNSFADIALYARGGLKIYNTFELQAPADLVYFMLAIARQHKINEKKVGVLLSGNISEYVNEVAAFFPSIIQANSLTTMSLVPELLPIADHRFAHLFSLYECA